MRRYNEGGVEIFEAEIEGETIRWDDALTYGSHLRIEQLLAAQAPVSGQPEEMLFIVMHQTMELWIKLVLHELRRVMERLRARQFGESLKLFDRVATIQRHMIHSWEVLATLTPHDFMTFRSYLRRASGFQSHQYRELEFLLGNKRADYIVFHHDDPQITARLTDTPNAPSLYDEILQLLATEGLDIPADRLSRDWSQPYERSQAVEDAWLAVYSDVERWPLLYQVGERLSALEYYFQEWRFKHMKTVARVIGQKGGTAGSSGVDYLVRALSLSFFPELWAMRTRMTSVPPQPFEDRN